VRPGDQVSPWEAAQLARLERARDAAVATLLAERDPRAGWTGELSSSALSTATAVVALTLCRRHGEEGAAPPDALIRGGLDWLVRNANADGGWGDTTRSFSNLSTTVLVWAAFALAPEHPGVAAAERAAEAWLVRKAGSVRPDDLVRAIEARYGADRTFSIPILTLCALCGRLGPGRAGWARVRALPFEVAVLPQRWFGALRLPVVSYALPALIAIGQVRHGLGPVGNPLTWAVRRLCLGATRRKLASLQPANGGFLEATPLTSFVTMSLAALGLTDLAVTRRGIAFIVASVRPDGSWPIDTNLATWVTTLSVNALGSGEAAFAAPARAAVREAIVRQQYRREHPYTLAAPGGWSWTDLPGGVPDADDTAGALLALRQLAVDPATRSAAAAGVTWLLDLQNRDGGVPTFCRGWGWLPFDRSSPDITAHALRAWLAWRDDLPAALQRRIDGAGVRAADYLRRVQREDGSWVPLWFGHQEDPADENPLYGTARVLPAFCELASRGGAGAAEARYRALRWLIARQARDGGWSGAAGAAGSTEETALALEALAVAWGGELDTELRAAVRGALQRGAPWLVAAVEAGRWREPAPIGFYFAKLWYFERLYPVIFATGALVRLAGLRA